MTDKRIRQTLVRMTLIGLAYYAGAWIGVHQTITPEGIAVLWPPNAVLLAAFLVLPFRQWPAVAVAALCAELAADLPSFPLPAALAFGLINLLETSVAAWLIRHFTGGEFSFRHLRNGACFLLFGPLLSSTVAALLGAGVYLALGRADSSYLMLWRLWWFGDALGLLLLTPLFVTLWQRLASRHPLQFSWAGGAELLLLWLATVLIGMLAFVQDTPTQLSFHFSPILLVPLGIWSALRFGVAGATLTVSLIASLAVGHLTRGIYPYPGIDPQDAVWVTQEYLAIVAVLSVGLAILLHEIAQQRLTLIHQDNELKAQNSLLEARIAERTADLEHANQALQQANTQLHKVATTDYLTGFPNRRHFETQAQRELNRLTLDHSKAALIMFDLDHFKSINDIHGHEAGDAVLRELVAPVQAALRPRDLCARLGGEEFVILLSHANRQQARHVAERIRHALGSLEIVQGTTRIHVSASFGVAQWDGSAELHELIQQADMALYRAKSSGRNCVMT